MSVDDVICHLMAWVDDQDWSTCRLAREAAVPESTLRGWRRPDWSPTVATLRKLEAVVPHDWRPSSPVSSDPPPPEAASPDANEAA
ncbi:hypothetical protein F1188_20165 [Roseospira marina]|uniref:Helix-turn-helix transcriptional regulator n=1 Tax=Roseospira marina TaxID=140057 RepID=A0A5M6I4A4_9PROT|nr:hypothetical protein [Roseospira marina]KAA5603002.1 hypothetical protein F1188_20165 [Roseospira marina]MBB4313036.1 hypothetical protein [Roseospira marina]MBB5089299.1 hypothetical protein [Roseospira marina]